MAIPIGVKTVTTQFSLGRQRITIEQEWFLHPTKGWKRGPRRRKATHAGWVSGIKVWERWKDWRK